MLMYYRNLPYIEDSHIYAHKMLHYTMSNNDVHCVINVLNLEKYATTYCPSLYDMNDQLSNQEIWQSTTQHRGR